MANHESISSIGKDNLDGWVPAGEVPTPIIFEPLLEKLMRRVEGKMYLPGFIAEIMTEVNETVQRRLREEAENNNHPTNPGGRHWCNPGRGGGPRGPGSYELKKRKKLGKR